MSSQMSFSSTNSTSVGTQSSREPLPFLVAQYEGQKFTVLRSISYQSTIASVKRNIASLQETLDDHIFILAILPGVCDYVRITKDVWASLCDKLMVVRVEQDTYDWSKSSKRECSPEIRTDKKRAKYNRPSSDQGLPVGENAVAESSQVLARAMRDCRESHGGQFSNIEHGSPWGGGKNIGQMKFNKRRTKRGPNLKPSTWSYSNDGLDRFSPNHRAEGDIHLSPKHSDSDSFDHWDTIASLKRNISGLKVIPNDQIFISAFIEEVDDHVRITEDVWTSLCPNLVAIRVGQNTCDRSRSLGRESSPDAWADKIYLESTRPRSQQALENAMQSNSQVLGAKAVGSYGIAYEDSDSDLDDPEISPWGEKGPMKYGYRPTMKVPPPKPLTWSYFKDGIDRNSPDHRDVGDVHVSRSPSGSEGCPFSHWVCLIRKGEKQWVKAAQGYAHPTQKDYVLRCGTVCTPPRWVLPKSLDCANYRKQVQRNSY
ncbi:ubiquitin family protein [Rhizoctonia solani]|uniref:Ubiquitin family protein n=1 Tax=Rhizoctonia solani TaxID=456999 RepID=A0A8H8P2W7_9AGAM|nr:ubiquitin family protein [Rhizoctonia solani]QRW23658.1 ubiquitin family protein [Rhizoctonia solani]